MKAVFSQRTHAKGHIHEWVRMHQKDKMPIALKQVVRQGSASGGFVTQDVLWLLCLGKCKRQEKTSFCIVIIVYFCKIHGHTTRFPYRRLTKVAKKN